MIIKVCGITNQEDATVAVEAGATAIGFNFYPKSPRYLTWEQARAIRTPLGVLRVGVFVDGRRQDIEDARRAVNLDIAQMHGKEATLAEYPGGTRFWKALQVGPGFDLEREDDGFPEALLLDGPAGDLYGGSGKTFDWSLVKGVSRRIILAGGLDATNVMRAVEIARPWGVDACSKIECAPGKKDHQKMKEFLWAARLALLT
jgi:phosphoribosylanthranilate isomerase